MIPNSFRTHSELIPNSFGTHSETLTKASRKIPETFRKLPEPSRDLPEFRQNFVGAETLCFCNSEILAKFRKVSGRFWKVSGGFWKVPGHFDEILETFQRFPSSFQNGKGVLGPSKGVPSGDGARRNRGADRAEPCTLRRQGGGLLSGGWAGAPILGG